MVLVSMLLLEIFGGRIGSAGAFFNVRVFNLFILMHRTQIWDGVKPGRGQGRGQQG